MTDYSPAGDHIEHDFLDTMEVHMVFDGVYNHVGICVAFLGGHPAVMQSSVHKVHDKHVVCVLLQKWNS